MTNYYIVIDMDPLVFGVGGAAIMLIAFALNEMHQLNQDSVWYDVLNFVGAALLTTYAILIASIPFAVLNGIWACVALRDIVLFTMARK